MIKFTELKKGSHVIANFDGDKKRGEIEDTDNVDKKVFVNVGEQSYWFPANDVSSIEVNDAELQQLKFTKQTNDEGNIKYLKGAFRLLIPKEGDFSRMEIWYRDEQRHITDPIPLHVLQNHFYEMTKVHLNEVSFN